MGRPRNKPIRLSRQIAHRDERGKYDGRFGWPGMMTIEAAADYLMISDTKLHQIRRRGEIKAIKDGANVRFSRRELDRYIARREQQTNGLEQNDR